jgi:hypothetical protein
LKKLQKKKNCALCGKTPCWIFKQKNCKSRKKKNNIKKWRLLDSLNVWENDLNPKFFLQKQIERSNSKHGKVEVI